MLSFPSHPLNPPATASGTFSLIKQNTNANILRFPSRGWERARGCERRKEGSTEPVATQVQLAFVAFALRGWLLWNTAQVCQFIPISAFAIILNKFNSRGQGDRGANNNSTPWRCSGWEDSFGHWCYYGYLQCNTTNRPTSIPCNSPLFIAHP